MLSTEKVPMAAEQLLAAADIPAPFGLMVPQLMPLAMGAIPDDHRALDEGLAQLAQQLLDLRSDHAPALGVLPVTGMDQRTRAELAAPHWEDGEDA